MDYIGGNLNQLNCQCANWARADCKTISELFGHHKNCPNKGNDDIRCIKISAFGNAMIDKDIDAVLKTLPDLLDDDERITVEFITINKYLYEALDEFSGF
jgi:hypothetical protein